MIRILHPHDKICELHVFQYFYDEVCDIADLVVLYELVCEVDEPSLHPARVELLLLLLHMFKFYNTWHSNHKQ